MPQFVQTNAQNVNPALQALQQAGAQRRDTAEEQARLNAAQYMKDFRQDAQNAGYSLGEWATRNEESVKNALFSLSGNNQQVTDAKFQELANAPESFDQKKQRLLDVEASQAPSDLFGTPDTFKTTQEIIPGREATKAVGMEIGTFREKAKGMRNILDAGKILFGENVNLDSRSGTPESLQFLEWRKNVAKAYGLDNFTGSGTVTMPNGAELPENEWLMLQINSGDPVGAVEIGATPGDLNEVQQKNLDSIMADKASFKGSSEQTIKAIEDRLDNDPAYKEGVKKAALDVLAKGGKIPVTGSPFSSWTPELFESLFDKGSEGGTYNFAGSLPPLKFEGTPATEDVIIDTKVLDKKGVPGFLQVMESTFQKVLEEGGTFGAQDENAIVMAKKKAEADLQTAKSNAERNLASARLMEVQAYESMARVNAVGSPDLKVYQQEYFKSLATFKEKWTDKAIKDIKPGSLQETMYQAEIAFLSSLSNMGGFGTGFSTLERDRALRTDQQFPFPGAVGFGGGGATQENAVQVGKDILNK